MRQKFISKEAENLYYFLLDVKKEFDFNLIGTRNDLQYLFVPQRNELPNKLKASSLLNEQFNLFFNVNYFKFSEYDIKRLKNPLEKYKAENDFYGFLIFCISIIPSSKKGIKLNWNSIEAIDNL